mmetsp:Transcript_58321/g.114711  ORF Transcript_58321/g.114711 Transcript_58321/m.114711 type:complete len:325 (-) Transcript_58321:48-1022(-)
MSSSSLLQNGDGERRSLASRTFRSMLGLKDQFQDASIKAITGGDAGPKIKYLHLMMDSIQRDHMKLEDFVITCHALAPWDKKLTICCRFLSTLLVILQTGPPVVSTAVESLNQFLTDINDVWASEDMFVSQFSIYLQSRISFLAEHSEFSNHFNLNSTSTNGLSLPQIDPAAEVTILSQMLSMQNRLSGLIRLGLKNAEDMDYFRAKERSAVKSALILLYEDAFCFHVANTEIFRLIFGRSASTSGSDTTVGMISVLREMYDEQFTALKMIYTSLRDTSTSFSNTGSYSALRHELSRCPEENPLSESSASRRPASALNIGPAEK